MKRILGLLLLIPTLSLTQNIVPNWNFDNYTACPPTSPPAPPPGGWNNPSDPLQFTGWRHDGVTAADAYIQACGFMNQYQNHPWTWYGTQPGDNYVGMIGWIGWVGLSPEYIAAELTGGPVTGSYKIGLSVIRGDQGFGDGYACAVGIKLGADTFRTPQVWPNGMQWMRWDTTAWITGVDSIFIFMTTPCDSAASPWVHSYFFLDSIVVEQDAPLRYEDPRHYPDDSPIDDDWKRMGMYGSFEVWWNRRLRKKRFILR